MDAIIGSIVSMLFFFVLFFVLPNMRRQQAHQALIKSFSDIQRKRKSRLMAIVHRQEPMGLLGIPMVKYIDLNDAEDVLDAIARTPSTTPLEIVLHTPGGLVLSALQIARAIKAHPAKTTVFVPHYAMSGGTLIALAADEIVMSPHAVLGPIDPQIGGLPAASILRVKQEKTVNAMEDYSLILADVGEMAIRQLQSAAYELLSGNVSDNAAQAVAEQLSSGRWTHDYPITPNHAADLGLNVSTEMPAEIMEMMALFPSRISGDSVKTVEIEEAGASARFPHYTRPSQLRPYGAGNGQGNGMTGFQPGPGAQTFSYGPWKADDLPSAGPAKGEIRASHGREPTERREPIERRKRWWQH